MSGEPLPWNSPHCQTACKATEPKVTVDIRVFYAHRLQVLVEGDGEKKLFELEFSLTNQQSYG